MTVPLHFIYIVCAWAAQTDPTEQRCSAIHEYNDMTYGQGPRGNEMAELAQGCRSNEPTDSSVMIINPTNHCAQDPDSKRGGEGRDGPGFQD